MDNDKLFNEFPPVSTEEWEKAIEKDLKGADYNKKLVWKTGEGFDVKPYYRANDIENLEYLKSNPDQEPFVRGYRKQDNNWDVRQDFESECPKEQNAEALQALNRGANSIGFNAIGIKSDKDMDALLKDIDVSIVKINFIKADNYLKVLELYVSYLKRNNICSCKAEGSINFDVFAFALKHGNYYNGLEADMDELAKIFAYAKQNLPQFKLINASGVALRNAGSNITQELAYTLAMANDYVARLTDKGIEVEDIAKRMSLCFATGGVYFMEIAKIRAARLLWSNIIGQYKGSTTDCEKIYIHCENTVYNKTVFDAHVNLLRTTTETMSSAVAGADSICVKPFDVALGEGDDFSRRIALNQQILLKEESYMNKVVDPAAGSYYIETLTNNIAEQSWNIFKEIENMGGFAKAIEQNYVQDKIAEFDAQVSKDVARRKKVIVGTNQYPNLAEKKVDYKAEKKETPKNTAFKALSVKRSAEPFEKLRLDVMNASHVPTIFLLLYGNLAMRTARAGFSSNFFGVAGYEVANNRGFDTIDEAAEGVLKAGNDIVVLCSSDDEYPELVKEILPKLKGKIKHIVVAGNPSDEQRQEFDALGVTDYINVRTNALESLTKYNEMLLK